MAVNMDPGLWARVMGYVFPPANAAENVTAAPNPLTNPTPVPPSLQGGGPPVPTGVGADRGGGLSVYGGLPPGVSSLAPTVDPVTGLPMRVPTSGGPIAPAMPYAGGQGPIDSSGANPLLTPAQPNTAVGWGTPETGGGVNWGADPTLPDFNRLPASAGGSVTVHPRARIPSTARADVPPAAASPNDRFIAIPYGTAQRGPGSTPMITALNLGGLFGGGAANPANVPSRNARPMSGGALSKGGADALTQAISKPDWYNRLKPAPLSAADRTYLQKKAAARSGFA